MKRLLALCLSSCLCLPLMASSAGLLSLAMSPTVVLAQAEVIDAESLEQELVDYEHDHDHSDHAMPLADHDAHGDDAKTPILSFDVGSAFWNLVIFVSCAGDSVAFCLAERPSWAASS